VDFKLLLQFIHIDFLGLINGCQGIVKKICYLLEFDVCINLPSVVFVQCQQIGFWIHGNTHSEAQVGIGTAWNGAAV
jgi:hypothetical protein